MTPTRTVVERPKLDDWTTVSEVFYASFIQGTEPQFPAIVIRRHNGTGELRIDVYGCDEGIPLTYTNGGTNDSRAKWYRDALVRRGYSPMRVRFLGSDLELHS